jgi:hypothetical protein
VVCKRHRLTPVGVDRRYSSFICCDIPSQLNTRGTAREPLFFCAICEQPDRLCCFEQPLSGLCILTAIKDAITSLDFHLRQNVPGLEVGLTNFQVCPTAPLSYVCGALFIGPPKL